eukprot:SAG22_NODE_1020_length_5999_cov_8.921186_7_plen_74_part_00
MLVVLAGWLAGWGAGSLASRLAYRSNIRRIRSLASLEIESQAGLSKVTSRPALDSLHSSIPKLGQLPRQTDTS